MKFAGPPHPPKGITGSVTPVLQLGWVDIDLVDSVIIILTCVTSRREASTDALTLNDYYEILLIAN